MRKIPKLIICLLFFLLINHYSFGQENPLIGKWEVVEGTSKATFEFFEDGTYTICVPHKIITKGPYKLTYDNQIIITLINPEGKEKNTNFKFSISDEGLLKLTYLNEENGEPISTTVYKRIESGDVP
ncbi:MAG: DUF5640 domain-containing protein [Candidatus Omnitrophota bacterium]